MDLLKRRGAKPLTIAIGEEMNNNKKIPITTSSDQNNSETIIYVDTPTPNISLDRFSPMGLINNLKKKLRRSSSFRSSASASPDISPIKVVKGTPARTLCLANYASWTTSPNASCSAAVNKRINSFSDISSPYTLR